MTLVFERTWGDSGASATAIGPDGTVYVAGLTVVGEYPLQDTDATLLKWSAGGDLLWARSWRGVADESAEAVAVDASGAAYVTGMTTSFGIEAFLLKFDAAGNLEWQRTWGGGREEGGEGVVVGADGGIYVTGVTQSFGTFPGAITFLLKFTPDGALVWERTWETPAGGLPRDIAASPDGGIYVGGLAYPRGFVAKFAADGALVWDRTYLAPAPTGFTDFEGLGATPDGGIVVVGSFMPTFDQEVLIVRFAADGALLYERSWGGGSEEIGVDAAVAADGTAYVVGETRTFSGGNHADLFILKVLPSGRAREARTWGGPMGDFGRTVAIGENGDLFVAGSAGTSPYVFGSAPSQMFRVRRATVTDPAAIVGIPGGTIGTPGGAMSVLEVTVGPSGAAVLLRVSPR